MKNIDPNNDTNNQLLIEYCKRLCFVDMIEDRIISEWFDKLNDSDQNKFIKYLNKEIK